MKIKKSILLLVVLLLSLACLYGEGMGTVALPPDEDFGVPLPPDYDFGVFCFFELEDGIVAKAPDFETFFSPDGGLTWQQDRFDKIGISSAFDDVSFSGSACSFNKQINRELWVQPDGQTRYRFYPGERIEVSVDSGQSWEIAFDLSSVQWEPNYSPDPEREMIVKPGPSDAMIDPKTGNLLLAMGHAGVLVRLPSGEWHWVEVGQYAYAAIESTPTSQVTDKENVQLSSRIQVTPDFEIDTENHNITTLIFSIDRNIMAASGAVGGVQFFTFPEGDLIFWLQWGEDARFGGLYGAVLSVDEETLVTCGTLMDQSLRIWDVESNELIKDYEGYYTNLMDTGAYTGEQYFAIAFGKPWYSLNQVKIFHLPDGLDVHTFYSQLGNVTSIKFISETRYLAVGSASGGVEVLDYINGKSIKFLKPDRQPNDWVADRSYVSTLGYDSSRNVVLALLGNGRLHAYDLSTGESAWQLALPILQGWYFSSSAFSKDGRLVAVGMHNGPLLIFDSSSGEMLSRQYITDAGRLQQLAFSSDNQWVVAGFSTGKIRAWQIDNLLSQD